MAPSRRTVPRMDDDDAIVRLAESAPGWRQIDAYIANGAGYVVAIDPFDGRIETRGAAPVGLDLDTEAIARA